MPTQSSFSALQPDGPGTHRSGPRTLGGSGVGVYKHGSFHTDKLAAAALWLVLAFSRAEHGCVEGTSGAGKPFLEPGLGASDLPLRQLPGGWDRAARTWRGVEDCWRASLVPSQSPLIPAPGPLLSLDDVLSWWGLHSPHPVCAASWRESRCGGHRRPGSGCGQDGERGGTVGALWVGRMAGQTSLDRRVLKAVREQKCFQSFQNLGVWAFLSQVLAGAGFALLEWDVLAWPAS